MTNDELKQALFNKRPVIHNMPSLGEIEYKCVSAIIYRVNKEGKLDISAELTDKCGHSVSTADPALLRYAIFASIRDICLNEPYLWEVQP